LGLEGAVHTMWLHCGTQISAGGPEVQNKGAQANNPRWEGQQQTILGNRLWCTHAHSAIQIVPTTSTLKCKTCTAITGLLTYTHAKLQQLVRSQLESNGVRWSCTHNVAAVWHPNLRGEPRGPVHTMWRHCGTQNLRGKPKGHNRAIPS
jgi:hypothetical protein